MIAAGGAIGALARYGIDAGWPAPATGFPWATLLINVSGSALLAALLRAGSRVWRHPLIVLFTGPGLLGGFTTFSTYAVQTDKLLADHPLTALGYLSATLAAAVAASSLIRASARRAKT